MRRPATLLAPLRQRHQLVKSCSLRRRRPATRLSPAARFLAAALAVAVIQVTVIVPAFAHETLRSSTPADGETVARTPAEVVLDIPRS